MPLKSILIIVVFALLFAAAVMFIARNGGWQQGCNGNCKDCHEKCDTKTKNKKE